MTAQKWKYLEFWSHGIRFVGEKSLNTLIISNFGIISGGKSSRPETFVVPVQKNVLFFSHIFLDTFLMRKVLENNIYSNKYQLFFQFCRFDKYYQRQLTSFLSHIHDWLLELLCREHIGFQKKSTWLVKDQNSIFQTKWLCNLPAVCRYSSFWKSTTWSSCLKFIPPDNSNNQIISV